MIYDNKMYYSLLKVELYKMIPKFNSIRGLSQLDNKFTDRYIQTFWLPRFPLFIDDQLVMSKRQDIGQYSRSQRSSKFFCNFSVRLILYGARADSAEQ
jgi:hypothetical protein